MNYIHKIVCIVFFKETIISYFLFESYVTFNWLFSSYILYFENIFRILVPQNEAA